MPTTRTLYGERDRKFFQRLDDESIRRSGVEVTYFSLERGKNVDPLYNEPKGWRYTKFCLRTAHIEYQELDGREVSVRDEGKVSELTARLNVSVIEWESRAPIDPRVTADRKARQRRPKEGDVVQVQREYWNVVRANSAGNVVDQPTFTGYQMELRKRLKFIAQRQTEPVSTHLKGADEPEPVIIP
jgi:hypothetical protein